MDGFILADLINKYGLPLNVKKKRWYGNYYFRAERIASDRIVSGVIVNNGKESEIKTFLLSEEMCLTDDNSQSAEKPNPNNLEINKDFYVSGETKLFVNKNGRMLPAIFECFSEKKGREVIYLICEGEKCFYYFPETKYVFLNRDDCNAAVSKASRKNETVYSVADRIVSAFNKLPDAHIPLSDSKEELKRESKYHASVDRKLKSDMSAPEQRKAYEANKIRELNEEYAQNAKDVFDDGGYVDEHTMISFSLNKKRANDNLQYAEEEIRKIEEVRKQPYFARVDCGKSLKTLHSAYIGETDVEGFVFDWRNSYVGNAYYHTEILSGRDNAVVALKRRFDIKNAEFKGFYDELNAYTEDGVTDSSQNTPEISGDEMLTQLLTESREDKSTHDIIKTIQSEQYEIITSDFNQNAVINGCAGSGKTMIMYHRLSYMAYNYETYTREKFVPENIYVISPSRYFDVSNNVLLKKLSIEKINQSPFVDLTDKLIFEYCKQHGVVPFHGLSSFISSKGAADQEFYTEKAYSSFASQVNNINFRNSSRDEFKKWVVASANRFLEIAGFDVIDPEEFLKKPSGILMKFETASYFRNNCFHKTRKNRYGKEEVYGYFNKSAITGISYENILESLELSDSDGETYKKRKKRLEKNSEILKCCLSSKTRLDAKGNIYTNIPDFWNLLEKAETFEKMLALILAEKLLRTIAGTTNNQDLILKCLFIYEKNLSSERPKDIYLYVLRVLSDKYGSVVEDKSHIFIDEFQNYSSFELECIDKAFLNPVYNLYGDFDQRIEAKGADLKNGLEKLISPNTYNINVNYRNAKQITEYINRAVHKNMQPIGVEGRVSEKSLKENTFDIDNRTAVIAKDTELALHFLKMFVDKTKINYVSKSKEIKPDVLNLMNVSECKGLEFDTVYVFDCEMSENEKYVSFTRALDRLTVIKDDLQKLKKEEEQRKKEEARRRREEKKKTVELTKFVYLLEAVCRQKTDLSQSIATEKISAQKNSGVVVEQLAEDISYDIPDICFIDETDVSDLITDINVISPDTDAPTVPAQSSENNTENVDSNTFEKTTESDDESKETIYRIAVGKYESDDISVLTEAIVLLATVIGYKDSAKKIDLFREKISSVSKKEAERKQYRDQKKCQYCGGDFKGFFKQKCKNCGRVKDY